MSLDSRIVPPIARFISAIEPYTADAITGLVSNALVVFGIWVALPPAEHNWKDSSLQITLSLGVIALIGVLWSIRKSYVRDIEDKRLRAELRRNSTDLTEANSTVFSLEQALSNAKADQSRLTKDFIASQISILSKRLDFGNDQRISVYIFNAKHFTLASRFSGSPAYGDRGGRTIYPMTEGCLGRAWREQYHEVQNLPDFDSNPRGYIKSVATKCGISAKVARDMRMKARSCIARRLVDDRSAHVGVIVLESLAPQISHDSIDDYLDQFEQHLGHSLRTYKEIFDAQNGEAINGNHS